MFPVGTLPVRASQSWERRGWELFLPTVVYSEMPQQKELLFPPSLYNVCVLA